MYKTVLFTEVQHLSHSAENPKTDAFRLELYSVFSIVSWADLKTVASLAVPVERSPKVILLP